MVKQLLEKILEDLGVSDQTRSAGKALPHAHAFLLIQEQRVGFDWQVMF